MPTPSLSHIHWSLPPWLYSLSLPFLLLKCHTVPSDCSFGRLFISIWCKHLSTNEILFKFFSLLKGLFLFGFQTLFLHAPSEAWMHEIVCCKWKSATRWHGGVDGVHMCCREEHENYHGLLLPYPKTQYTWLVWVTFLTFKLEILWHKFYVLLELFRHTQGSYKWTFTNINNWVDVRHVVSMRKVVI